MSKTKSDRRRALRTPGHALLLVGVSVVALATSNASFARPLNSGTGSPSVAAAAAAAAAAANRQNQQAAQQTRDTLSRVTRAVQSMRDIQDRAREAARTRPSPVPNGLGKGGLDPAVKAPKAAGLDPTGMETWDGAKMPTEAVKDGLHTVTIEQTDSRAILSWKTFNVGKDTTLVFDQDGNKDWVVLNRVVGGLDENGRRTAALDPTKILGSIKADGTVLIMNQNGVIFGAGAQIRTNSLVATTAEIGRGFRFIGTPDPTNRLNNEFEALTLVERNLEFMQYGLLGVRDSLKTDLERNLHSEFMPYFDNVVLANGRRDVARENDAPSGGVFVEAGAEIQLGKGGFALLNSTRVENAGRIVAPEANVSLVAAWGASLIASNGASADGNNPYYRGLMGFDPTGRITPGFDGSLTYVDSDGVTREVNDDLGEVFSRNTGIIEAPRGAIRLIENAGVLLSTTSVSRNGYIAIDRAMPGSVTSILADTDPETIPLDRESIANFKASRIEIGYYVGADALVVAPGGDVVFGPPVDKTQNGRDIEGGQRVLVESGAIIDVAGLTDVIVLASRNAIKIGPLKGNELADAPGLRDSFLDGATIYVDPRKSGVREDGVAWIGSPLVDAASYYAQVGVTASELLTKGGNVTFATLRNSGDTLGGTTVSDTIVETGAVIDISGGSVRYQGGAVRTTSLIGADGRIYDISQADPLKMKFVGFGAGFTQYHERWGVARSYNSPLRPSSRMEREYDEGRDAGTLDLPGDVLVFEGSVKAGVIVGDRQRADPREGTGSSKFDWDQRLVQGAGSELPVAGAIRIGGDLSGGNEVKIVSGDDMPKLDGPIGYGRDFSEIDSTFPTTETGEAHGPIGPRDDGSALSDDRIRTTYISADMLNEAGFGQIEIARGGDIMIEKKASVTLADGGLFTAASGGSIRVDGSITAASGVVALETAGSDAPQTNFDIPRKGYSPYDIVVNGTISVRGKWVNDFQTADGKETGGAHLDGGTIVLFAGQGVANTGTADPTKYRDISGSVLVNAGATLDVSGGGRVDRNGDIDVSAKGGDLALISEVNYFAGATEFPGIYVRSQHVNGVQPIVPDEIIAKVAIDSGATVLSHGFGGGGTFQLVTPEFSFGEKTAKVGTALSMDFISEQGFQNYDITSYKTKIVESKFRDDFNPDYNRGYDAFLDTQTLKIKAGETLRLRNSVFSLLPSGRSAGDIANLKTLESGGDLYSVLSPTTLADTDGRDNAFYRQPVNLSFGGTIELKVAKGGKLIGEAGATLTTPRLINEGLIRLPGGNIVQRATLPQPIAGEGRAVRDPYEGLIAREDGTYRESDLSNVTNADGRRLTNGEAYVGYLLGELAADVGVELRKGSVTDLSGVSLRDPLARDGAGQKISSGRILSGGSITMTPEADRARGFKLFPGVDHSRFAGDGYKDNTNFKKVLGLKLVAEEGSRLDLSGAKDVYQRPSSDSAVNPGKPIDVKVWSDAGGIYASNGATLTGADIDAHGGSSKARGGVLEIGDLVLTQTDTETPLANTVSADMITRSGFDLLHARGSVDTIGDVDLTLGRAFFLTSREIIDQTGQGAIRDPRLYANVGADGALSISADYIRLEGYSQTVSAAPVATGTGSVAFSAGQIDVVGGVRFDETVGSATLDATGDVRLVGQSDVNRRLPADAIGSTILSDKIGMHLAVGGDLTIRASRVYPATGTTALVTSSGAASTIRFERAEGSKPTTPYSAGADLKIQAAHIQQNGALFTPHGSLTLGSNEAVRSGSNILAPVTETVTLGAGGLTSVSGGQIRIPYGVTTDLTEYYFSPLSDDALSQTPEKRLTLGGGEVVMEDGAKIDVSGGGDLFAYEFIPGTGGSRDVLDRLNVDQFSSNGGLTYPDGRQVYAIVPGLSDDAVAAFDPYFSSGYDALGRPSMAGARVYLEGGKGLKAGWYTLLPAKYAVLPGGLRIVEQPGGPGLYSTGSATLADGTMRVSGRYGQFGSSDWRWRRFDVQTQSTFLSYSNIALTSAQATFAKRAAEAGEATPRLPLDAGSLTFDARTRLTLDGTVDSTPGKGGRGVTVDVGGSAIYVVADPTKVTLRDGTVLADGAVVREIDGRMVLCADAASTCAAGSKERLSDVAPLLIAADDLTRLGAESLLIGGTRAQQSDGTVEIRTTAYRLVVANDKDSALAAPEILLAVGVGQNELVDATGQPVDPNDTRARVTRDVRDGPAKALIIADGAVIEARGEVRDRSTADYVAAGGWVGRTYSATDPGSGYRRSTVGAFLRVANGPERIIRRDDLDLDAPETTTSRPDLVEQYERRYGVDLSVGSGALLSGSSVLADVGTYRNPTLSAGATGLAWAPKATLSIDAASIRAQTLTLGAGEIALTDGTVDRGVLAVSHDFLDGLRGGGASRLNLLSRDVIGIDGGVWSFGELALTTPGLESRDGRDVSIEATKLDFGNVADIAEACTVCGDAKLSIKASEIVFGEGRVATSGFGGGVFLTATQGLFAHGEGGLDVGASALTIDAPVIADRASPQPDETLTTVVPTEMTLRSAAAVRIVNTSTATLKPFERTPGAVLRIEGESLSVEGARISASAGMIDLKATGGDVTLGAGAIVEAPGYQKAFADVIRSAPAGSVRLQSDAGDVVIGSKARVAVGGEVGKAGALALVAQKGKVLIRGDIDGAAKEGDASILVDTGGRFDLDAFAALAAAKNFDGRVAVFSGAGDLTLGAGATLRAASLTLGADGGAVDIFGRIDTSGVNGGDVSLFGQTGVRLRDGSLIDTGATGYAQNDSRRAKSGSVTIGVGANGKISLDQGSTIDVSADRGEGRLVPVRREGQTYYYYAAADQGGSLNLRAPVIEGESGDRVDVAANGRVLGAHEVVLEAYKTWDLDAIADSGDFVGVKRDENGKIVLDVREGLDTVTYDSRTGRKTVVDAGSGVNLLGDTGAGTVASYIQDFDLSASLAALGDLGKGGNFHARPGVELKSKGDVTFASNWNLAAGVVDVDAALADGVMYVPASVGKPAVVFGREADLISDYTAMTYRVGGSALGEAGVVSIRAGGDLTVEGTITDGFFQFRNQTDDAFLPKAMAGQRPETAPYSAEANSAAAIGKDAAGGMELFPLIDGQAMGSFSLSFAAGADLDSADASRTIAASDGDFSVVGLNSYVATSAASRPTSRTAYYRNLIRTGAGEIDVAAAGSIDLRGEEDPIFVRTTDDRLVTDRKSFGDPRQIGGAAIYSAGRRVKFEPITVLDASGRRITLDTTSLLPTSDPLRAGLSSFTYAATSSTTRAFGPAGVLVGDLAFAQDGGDVTLTAGRDVLGRRDLARSTLAEGSRPENARYKTWMSDFEPWRQGQVGQNAAIRINAAGFYDGVGALAGGDVTVTAGRDVSDLNMVSTTSLASAPTSGQGVRASKALLTFGSGDVFVSAGRDILGGRVDVASGEGLVTAARSVASAGDISANVFSTIENTLRLRLSDAEISVSAGQGVDMQGVAALGAYATQDQNSLGFYTARAGVSIDANSDVLLRNDRDVAFAGLSIWPGSFHALTTGGDLELRRTDLVPTAPGGDTQILMAPSPIGQLELLAAGDIAPTTLAMSDADPGILPGLFGSSTIADFLIEPEFRTAEVFAFPNLRPDASESEQRRQHAETPLHGEDDRAALVSAGRDISGVILSTPKETRVSAGRDILDMVFFGQNLDVADVTRIVAGRDIIASSSLTGARTLQSNGQIGQPQEPRATLQGNVFVIGGPGSFYLEAGRNAGPFLTSATVTPFVDDPNSSDPAVLARGPQVSFGGGVLSVGDEYNPWLGGEGADVTVMFGVGKGVAWTSFRDAYLDPANFSDLESALFVGGDRSRPVYGPKLIAWLKENAPREFEAATGSDSPDYASAYAIFKGLSDLRQRGFISEVYFGELSSTSDPNGPSFQQYQRGYRAVNTLFPGELGYTKNDLTGGSNGANEQIRTGDLDLRLATIQTSRGGDIRLFGPGGRVLAGSVVRTAQQIARRNYNGASLFEALKVGAQPTLSIDSIPSGYEGLLTVRGGSISTFTDSDVLLNQSRLFTQGGGDIIMWSSNGDLNGGEGPKTSSNFPPVVVNTDYNGFSIEDRRGSATGAGIAAFQPAAGVDAPDIFLVAPRGTVDAGAAGIRVAGNINVAAQTVANADNIAVGGTSVGVPSLAAAPIGGLSTNAGKEQAGQTAASTENAGGDQASIIIVEVLGYGGGESQGQGQDCPPDQPDCKAQPQ